MTNYPPSIPPGLMPGNFPQHSVDPAAPPQVPTAPAPHMPPPAAAPAMHGYDPTKVAAQASAIPGVPTIPNGAPDLSSVTDIDVPDLNDVHMRDFTTFDSKLKVIDPDPQLEYRWVNSDTQRFARLWNEGYRPVKNKGRARTEVENADAPTLFAGTDAHNAQRHAILMARPKFLREQRDARYREMVRNNQAALDPKQYEGNTGRDASSFHGALKMGGAVNG